MSDYVIASSVIRSAHQGQSHGGLYIVDLHSGTTNQVVDWNDGTINWAGRGMDRGLRGIDFYNDLTIVAASNEIFFYDQSFTIVDSFMNRYLSHCHEICVLNGEIFLTSTGFDSILVFDIEKRQFTRGYMLRNMQDKRNGSESYNIICSLYDPMSDGGPQQADTLHINNVCSSGKNIFFSALKLPILFQLNDNNIDAVAKIPVNTHNATPISGSTIVMNHTARDQILMTDFTGNTLLGLSVPKYDETSLLNSELPKDHARQSFGRGLCYAGGDLLVGGSSPATISLYSLKERRLSKTINISMDVRNSIHGLEFYPH